MKKILSTLFAFLFLAATAVRAGGDACAAISHDELKAAIASGKVVLIDVNGSDSYKEGHIPGAIDFEAKGAQLASLLPADKNVLVVAYCGGEKCTAYKEGAAKAAKLGYKNVRHYAAGISGWIKSGEKVEKAG